MSNTYDKTANVSKKESQNIAARVAMFSNSFQVLIKVEAYAALMRRLFEGGSP